MIEGMHENDFPGERDHPTLVAMHFLGGSASEWDGVAKVLGPEYPFQGIDFPGFGDAAGVQGYSVDAMVEHLAETLQGRRLRRFVLVGHSISGKVAMVAARWAVDGDLRFAGLKGLVLAAASPAGPEPMSDEKRAQMLAGLEGSSEERRRFAESYIQENTARRLATALSERAVSNVLQTDRDAWRAWLEDGSREDWAGRVGALELPTLLIAGEKDSDLGPVAQQRLVLPHLLQARMEGLAGVGHLLPLEAPEEVAGLLRVFVGNLELKRAGYAAIAPEYLQLIGSERVSAVTRTNLLARAAMDDPSYVPVALSPCEMKTLRALAERVLPQKVDEIDVAVRVDKRLALGTGKGWRYAELPGDLEAYRGGLAALDTAAIARHGTGFSELSEGHKDAVLVVIVSGHFETGLTASETGNVGVLTGTQMVRWFEDVRAELVGIYVSHPATLARIGYSGIADGGRTEAMTGFVELGMGKVEEWEPEADASVGSV